MRASVDSLTGRTPHREDVSTLAMGTSIALIGGLLASVVGWLAQLSLARLLGPGGFGTYSIGMAIVRIASQVSTLGLASATIYFVARYWPNEPGRTRDVFVQALGASFIAGSLIGAILFIMAPWIVDQFFRKPELVLVLRIFALTIGLGASFRVARAATTVSYRINYRVYLDLLTSGIFLFGFLFLYLLGGRLQAATVAFLLSSAIGFGAAIYALIRLFPAAATTSGASSFVLGDLLGYALPAFAAILFSAPLAWLDRLLIGYFRNPLEVGLFQAAAQSSTLLSASVFAVSAIAGPMIANLYGKGERGRLEDVFRVSTKWILYSTLILFLVVVAQPHDILKLFFGSRYQSSTTVLVILSIGAAIDAATGTARSVLLLTGHQRALLMISAVVLVTQIALGLYLIPRFGIDGAAVAELIAAVLLNAWVVLVIKKNLDLWPYDRRYLKGLLAATLSAGGLLLINPHGIPIVTIRLIVRGLIATSIFAVVLFALGLDSEDRQVAAAAFERTFRDRTKLPDDSE